jgi:hypothetical protein
VPSTLRLGIEHSLCTHERCAELHWEGYKHEMRVESVTKILESRYSPKVMSKPKKTSKFMEKFAVGCAPRLQNLPCKDLSGMFKDLWWRRGHTKFRPNYPDMQRQGNGGPHEGPCSKRA